jgi:hypothetical protein
MADYETRSYIGWHLAHVAGDGRASVFVGSTQTVSKKNDSGDSHSILTMRQAIILIIAALTQDPSAIKRAVRDVTYYQKSNTKAYRSHSKKRQKIPA